MKLLAYHVSLVQNFTYPKLRERKTIISTARGAIAVKTTLVSGYKTSEDPCLRPLDFEKIPIDEVFLLGYSENKAEVTITAKEFWDIEENYLYKKGKIIKSHANYLKILENLILSLEQIDDWMA